MSDNKELAGVQILRAVAVSLVVLDHIEGMLAMPKYFGVKMAQGYLAAGTVGVDLFFVISGFIICYVTGSLDGRTVTVGQFVLRRACRILPLLWLYVAFHFLSRSMHVGGLDAAAYLRAFTLYPLGTVHPDQVWTLRHEAIFYGFAALAIAGSWWRAPLWAFFVVPLAWAMVDPSSAARPEGSSLASEVFSLRANTGFAFGVLTALAFARFGAPNLRDWQYGALLLLSLPALLVVGNVLPMAQAAAPVASAVALAALCAGLVYLTLGMKAGHSRIGGAAVLVGAASYAIYLTHDAFISIGGVLSRLLHIRSVFAGSALCFALILVAGIVIHLRIEKPLVRAARRWAASLGRAMPGQAARPGT